ncbi:unnamed protein product [Timema podura]|uniref:Uncharacterized protein n=1 Tax=Timema podura TaxID=61482 RepID=A0ABN7P7J2_TIMPD|nr:unnamed protein product [Timema podura]
MALIVIAGVYDCQSFAHVDYVANHMSQTLPNFKIHRIVKSQEKWQVWLDKVCKKHNWSHHKSPLVWKEPAMRGGDAVYIGGASEFSEYCYEYYGFTCYFDKNQKQFFVEENIQHYQHEQTQRAQVRLKQIYRKVCITGATSSHTGLLLTELLQLPELTLKDGMRVFLHDPSGGKDKLRSFVQDLRVFGARAGVHCVAIIEQLPLALKSCDLFIVLQGVHRCGGQTLQEFLEDNHNQMSELGQVFDMHAPAHCRVIVAASNDTPTCFNASVLVDNMKNHSAKNVMVVTADLGLRALPTLADLTGLSLQDLAVPPVWGFIGDHFLVIVISHNWGWDPQFIGRSNS